MLNLPDVAGLGALAGTPLAVAGAPGAGALVSLPPAAGMPAQEDHPLAAIAVGQLRTGDRGSDLNQR